MAKLIEPEYGHNIHLELDDIINGPECILMEPYLDNPEFKVTVVEIAKAIKERLNSTACLNNDQMDCLQADIITLAQSLLGHDTASSTNIVSHEQNQFGLADIIKITQGYDLDCSNCKNDDDCPKRDLDVPIEKVLARVKKKVQIEV